MTVTVMPQRTAVETGTFWPPVRVLPAPCLDPAFDEDLPIGFSTACPGQLPMPAAARRRDPSTPGRSSDQPTPAPAVNAGSLIAVRRFVDACVEVLNGFRPIAHLRPHTGPLDFGALVNHLTRRAQRLRMTAAADAAARIRLRRLRLCEPREGVVEAAVVLEHRGAPWAM